VIDIEFASTASIVNPEARSQERAHRSSNNVMAYLMPSAPNASVPYGILDEPDMFFSTDTRSDSLLYNKERINKTVWWKVAKREPQSRTGVMKSCAKTARLLGS